MRRRIVIVSVFLCLSVFVYLFSQSVSSPMLFLASFFSPSRVFLHESVYAQKGSSELDVLRLENEKLKEQLLQMNAIKKDNIALRSQFEDSVISPQILIPSKIVGFKGSPQNPTGFVLDQGARSGIKKGSPIIVGNQLIGKIYQVNEYFSEVMLVIHKDFTTLAISGEHDSPGIITGFDEFMIFDHVTITDTISKNESVLTKGELNSTGIGIPPGLVIGKITRVDKSDTQPLQSAVVEHMIPFNSLSTVFVIKQ
ncbi:MAG: rod shape-determining protein MreC [Candidatus Levybacteria bacterium]|nr:rod shape-determining protein MreC [Candidatus Levybacteria bacterium]